jgi:hypothetical protein
MFVRTALKKIWARDKNQDKTLQTKEYHKDSINSRLIQDIFGGEILKTPLKNDWHFYNRINGERIDFSNYYSKKQNYLNAFEDLPSTPDETFNYVAQEDYSNLYMKFIAAYESAVGLIK